MSVLTAIKSCGSVGDGAQNSFITQAPVATVSDLFLCPDFGGSAKNIIPGRGIIPPFLCKVLNSRRQGCLKSLFVGVYQQPTQEVIMSTLNRRQGGKSNRTAIILQFKLPITPKTKEGPITRKNNVVCFPSAFSAREIALIKTFASLKMNPFECLAYINRDRN